MKQTWNKGQVGLVVLLIGAVLMTVGLGVASQSVMEIGTARQETDSSQAFNAAEQGIEAALQQSNYQSPVGGDQISGYTVNVTSVPQTRNYQATLLVGHSAQLVMSGVSELALSWTDTCASHRAVIVTLISSSYGISRTAYGQDCGGGDGFIVPDSCDATSCTTTITPSVDTLFARVKAIYGDVQLSGVLTGNNLPVQFYEITSTASKELGEARSVQVSKFVPSVSSIFDYALFSGGGIF